MKFRIAKTKKIVVIATLLIVFVVIPVGASFYFLYGNRHIPLTLNPGDYGLEYVNVTFSPRGDPIDLDGWFVPADTQMGNTHRNNATIILLHGHQNNKGNINEYNHSVFVTIGFQLHKLGYSLLLFDFRNHGLSDDLGPVTFGHYESRDVLGAVDFLRENSDSLGIDKGRIAVWGTSFGAGAGLIATANDSRSGDRYIK
ncbi:MAG: alpha/beta hydrolase, partial [Candidatus Heimdallarchaeota archaeon]|nr:alpha/beta hydrolase [Candidatus Heimdallarchaeota archaeon]